MKKMKLPAVMAALAAAGFGLRWLVYRTAVDGKNLIIAGHPVVIALWVLTAAALGLAAFAGWKQDQTAMERGADAPAFLGHGLLAVGMAMAVLLNDAPTAGLLGTAWKILGLTGAVCLLVSGFDRMRGKVPFFALYGAPCLFFAVHVVAHYQLWCANPQFTDYAFALLAAVALAVHSYELAADCENLGNRKIFTATALAAVYLCGAEMAAGVYPYLYLGGAVFCLTDLAE